MTAGAMAGPARPPEQARPGLRERFDRFVRWTIAGERVALAPLLPAGDREEFLGYYRNLPAPGDERATALYARALWRGDAGWVARWLEARAGAGFGVPRVMDAGSGFGTYSMLYATAGAEVTGADLRPDRLRVAEQRLALHARAQGDALPVRFERADLTRDWGRSYDLVWVYNALSHIDPLDGFLEAVRRHLRPGGVLVVGDINGGHPAHLERLAQLRTEVHQEYVAPDGERHAYAVERPFPPAEVRAEMERHGLRVVRHEMFWGGAGRLPDWAYDGVIAPLQARWRLGERWARRQMVVATPDVRAGG